MSLHLMSHNLCPYVQRAVISLIEKGVAFERSHIDLANKPEWFRAVSPLGKTPVLLVEGTAIFESAVILEYLEDTQPNPLHPRDPLKRARDRGWIEFGSCVLDDIGGLYNAGDGRGFAARVDDLSGRFARLEGELTDGPFFNGAAFGLVDAAFGPVFRYFDVFDRIGDFGVFRDTPKIGRWRRALSERPSVIRAVTRDHDHLLLQFLKRRGSYLSTIIGSPEPYRSGTPEGSDVRPPLI